MDCLKHPHRAIWNSFSGFHTIQNNPSTHAGEGCPRARLLKLAVMRNLSIEEDNKAGESNENLSDHDDSYEPEI
jgi:hypothetical protein